MKANGRYTYTMASYLEAPRFVLSGVARWVCQHHSEVLVIGGGAAGLMAALVAAQDATVTLLTSDAPLESNSSRAQGGVAAAMSANDSPTLHIEDTLIAGAGLSDVAAARMLSWEAPALMDELAALGVPFQRERGAAGGAFALGLEGSHSRRRILHVGDTTGLAITSTLAQHVAAHPRIHCYQGYHAVDLVGNDVCCLGALALDRRGRLHRFGAGATILATGGFGALYGLSSNQPGALGEGIAMAFRAGADVCDMEFVQFHPTVLRSGDGSGFLISEAARGEGGILRTLAGERFMPRYDERAELAPRDIVSRAIFDVMQQSGTSAVLLDMTHLSRDYLRQRFPTISERCRHEGIDLATTPVPVAPAAHYCMGGICTNLAGATSIAGLYAAGECACTGVHGANRLASNSLLECLVTGRRAGRAAVAYGRKQPHSTNEWYGDIGYTGMTSSRSRQNTSYSQHQRNGHSSGWVGASVQQGPSEPLASWRADLAALMSAGAGPLRTAEGLHAALVGLEHFPRRVDVAGGSEAVTAANAALVARLVVVGALAREESRGAHFRSDFPQTDDAWREHVVLRRGQAPWRAVTVADRPGQQEQGSERPVLDECAPLVDGERRAVPYEQRGAKEFV